MLLEWSISLSKILSISQALEKLLHVFLLFLISYLLYLRLLKVIEKLSICPLLKNIFWRMYGDLLAIIVSPSPFPFSQSLSLWIKDGPNNLYAYTL